MSIFCLCRLNLEACFNLRLGINNIKLVLHSTHGPVCSFKLTMSPNLCEFVIDHPVDYVPHSLQTMCGFL